MDFLIIGIVSLIGSAITLFSGFGLGTILVPVFGIFFPIELAVALTAIVHFLNNLFKLILVGQKAHLNTVIRFGLPSIIAAFAGAALLTTVSKLDPIYSYTFFNHQCFITPVKLIIAVLLLFFSMAEVIPALSNLQFPKKYIPIGGLLSGFFGGLSGNQGALRSAFLLRAGLTKEQYIATGVIIACMIDITRLSVYSGNIFNNALNNLPLLIFACACAFTGAYAGNKLVKKITVKTLQYIVAAALAFFGVILGLGLL